MRELLLRIDTGDGRRVGLERALRDAIRDGQLLPGTTLPSTRTLAADCGLARATVVSAYEQLVIEGYLIAKRGSGTRVADLRHSTPSPPKAETRTRERQRPAIDLRPGEPDPGLFPRAAWARTMRRILVETPDGAFGYPDPRGAIELRAQLSEYLGRSRAVVADPDGVSIFGGVTTAFGFIGEALVRLGIDRVAVENPSLFLLRDVLELVGVTTVPVSVDDDGVSVDELQTLDVGAAIVTPGHQFPLGVTMTPERRSELVAWARDRDAWIVEDDYDGEFRYDRRPIGALQGLDPDRVVYAGTASKILSPGLRLSWLVVPPRLRAELARVKHLRGTVSTVEQLTLADFIARGDLDRHLRQARGTYLERQQALADVLAPMPWLRVSPAQAGLHLAATIDSGSITEAALIARAAEHDLAVLGFGPFWTGPPGSNGLVIGYSRPPAHRFAVALERLENLLATVEA